MNEVAVHFAPNQVDVEVAASALRAHLLHPRVVRDDPMLGVAGGMSVGRFVVLVPEREAARARAVLREPIREEHEDNPVIRLVIVVAVIVGLLLTTPFVAGVCVGPP
ncbi:MAG: hypothetical protein ACRDG6_06810 [Candidatus Limnocylindria bacterium]